MPGPQSQITASYSHIYTYSIYILCRVLKVRSQPRTHTFILIVFTFCAGSSKVKVRSQPRAHTFILIVFTFCAGSLKSDRENCMAMLRTRMETYSYRITHYRLFTRPETDVRIWSIMRQNDQYMSICVRICQYASVYVSICRFALVSFGLSQLTSVYIVICHFASL